jgi:Flp pilus assembly protein TadD
VWVSLCLALGAALGLLAMRTWAAGPPTSGKALLGMVLGALAGAALGTVPGPVAKALRRAGALACRFLYEYLAQRKLAQVRRQCEADAAEENRQARLHLAGALWLEGARGRAEKVLQRLAETEPTWALARHNLAVTQAAAARLARAGEELGRAASAMAGATAPLWNLGLVRWHQGNLQDAAETFRELTEKAPDDLQARNALALALARQGEVDQGITRLEEGLRVGRRHPDILCNLGVIHQARGAMEVAEQYFAAALSRQPAHIAARYNRGICATAKGWYQAAIEDFAGVVRLAPDHAWALVQQAICWYRLGQSARALECARRASRYGENDFYVQYNAGTLMAREHAIEAALRGLEKAYELSSDQVDVIINLGVACHLAGRPRQALDHFRAAVRLSPRHALARYNCAVSYHMVDMLNEAEQQLEELLATYPEFPEAFNAIGVVRVLQNRLVEAAAQLRRAAETMPRSAVVRANLGLAYYLQGDLAAAGEQSKWAASIDSTLAAAHEIAGHVALQMGELALAIEHFRALVRIEPTNPDAHSNLGLAYYKDDRLNEAVECFRRVLVFSPHSPEGHNDLGLAYAKNKMPDEALRHLHQVRDWRPSNPIICSNIGVVHYFRGDAEHAVEQWREVTRLSPAYARRREATRFAAYDDQEMAARAIDARKRVTHFPLKVAGFRHSFQFALDEDDYRMELESPDLVTAARWQERARRARLALVRP